MKNSIINITAASKFKRFAFKKDNGQTVKLYEELNKSICITSYSPTYTTVYAEFSLNSVGRDSEGLAIALKYTTSIR